LSPLAPGGLEVRDPKIAEYGLESVCTGRTGSPRSENCGVRTWVRLHRADWKSAIRNLGMRTWVRLHRADWKSAIRNLGMRTWVRPVRQTGSLRSDFRIET